MVALQTRGGHTVLQDHLPLASLLLEIRTSLTSMMLMYQLTCPRVQRRRCGSRTWCGKSKVHHRPQMFLVCSLIAMRYRAIYLTHTMRHPLDQHPCHQVWHMALIYLMFREHILLPSLLPGRLERPRCCMVQSPNQEFQGISGFPPGGQMPTKPLAAGCQRYLLENLV